MSKPIKDNDAVVLAEFMKSILEINIKAMAQIAVLAEILVEKGIVDKTELESKIQAIEPEIRKTVEKMLKFSPSIQ
jgi:hypothetical protein